jgi:hypothetical protein
MRRSMSAKGQTLPIDALDGMSGLPPNADIIASG